MWISIFISFPSFQVSDLEFIFCHLLFAEPRWKPLKREGSLDKYYYYLFFWKNFLRIRNLGIRDFILLNLFSF